MNSVHSSYVQEPDSPCIALAAKNFDCYPPESASTFFYQLLVEITCNRRRSESLFSGEKYYFELIINITSKM